MKTIYAFMCTDSDGGILSIGGSPDDMKPLVVQSKDLALGLIPMVREIFGDKGKNVSLVEYVENEVVEEICVE